MNTRILNLDETLVLVAREESHFYDKKAAAVSGKSLQKIAVAFANADGGEIMIGITDDSDAPMLKDRWQGVRNIEALNAMLQNVYSIEPALDARYEFLQLDGEQTYVLRIEIEKSSSVHKTTAGIVYQRHGAQSLPVTDPQKLAELAFAKGSASYEDQVLESTPTESIVDSEELRAFLEGYSPRTDKLDFILNQNLIDYRSWEPRVAGVLLFHPSPSAQLPRKCAVKIARYETREDEPERDHLAEQRTIEGPLNTLIVESVEAVTEIMSQVQIWTAEGLKSLEYPSEAIWEVIVNAIIHRDYSISDDAQIYIYNDRIEVMSPGRLPGYVTTDNILDARFSRNPKIVRTLNRYRDAPNKDLGEGLNTAYQRMKEWGLKSPEIHENGNHVKVTLPHTPLAAPTESILAFLKSHDQITNRQARDLTGIRSENQVKNEFYKLRDENLIERVPGLAGPRSAWRMKHRG